MDSRNVKGRVSKDEFDSVIYKEHYFSFFGDTARYELLFYF